MLKRVQHDSFPSPKVGRILNRVQHDRMNVIPNSFRNLKECFLNIKECFLNIKEEFLNLKEKFLNIKE